METSKMPPKAPILSVEEENELVSQVLEIIGGITLEALQTLEQPAERDVWSREEGDDSLFNSNKDQTHQDMKTNTSCDFGANMSKHLVKSDAGEEPLPQRESDPEAGVYSDTENLKMENEATQLFSLTGQEEQCQELQTPKIELLHRSDSADPGAEANITSENVVSTSGNSLQPNFTNANMQTEPGQNKESETGHLQVKEEEVVLETEKPHLEPCDVTNEESYTRLNGEAEIPKEMPDAELKISSNRQLEVDLEPEQGHNFHFPAGFHQGPSPGYSTLPLPKKASLSTGHQRSFDHLTSSKYSTVSYRKIRRGNTRQKIEEFEFMIMNL